MENQPDHCREPVQLPLPIKPVRVITLGTCAVLVRITRVGAYIVVIWALLLLAMWGMSVATADAQTCPPGARCPTPQSRVWSSEAGRNGRASDIAPTVRSNTPKSACRIIGYVSANISSPGSGILIRIGNDFGLVLTCAHGPQNIIRHEVIFPVTDERFEATKVGVNVGRDLLLLKLQGKPSFLPAKLATSLPQPGERIYSGGFGMHGPPQWEAHPGEYRGQEDSKTDRGLFGRLMAWRGNMRYGDSGGPVWNQRGEIIGVNTGTMVPGQVGMSSGPGIDAVAEILVKYDDACAPAGPAPAVEVVVEILPVPDVPLGPVMNDDPIIVPAPIPLGITELRAQIAELQLQISELRSSGVQGPPGLPGPEGPAGPAGQPGQDAEPVDIEAVVAAIVQQLPPPRAPDIDMIVDAVVARLPEPSPTPKYWDIVPHK